MITVKECWTCHNEKTLDLFTKDRSKRDGYSGRCAECSRKANAAANIDRQKSRARQARYKERHPDRVMARQIADREASSLRLKEWTLRNAARDKERRKNYRKANSPKIRARIKGWLKRNPGLQASYVAKRRTAKLQATPVWANEFFIQEAYELADLRSKATGIKWEVDHIVPLQSPLVCGLHVEHNLQVIPAVLNRSKGNKFGEVCNG